MEGPNNGKQNRPLLFACFMMMMSMKALTVLSFMPHDPKVQLYYQIAATLSLVVTVKSVVMITYLLTRGSVGQKYSLIHRVLSAAFFVIIGAIICFGVFLQ
ncbi:uncharacterized protein A4U43_UnF4540 [Asparagus officinalis]|uniref:Uncharacterized protein n=1 Tax=Asparagus officinalis TaxID=4686 RepID=A0A1R3L6U8_ASPOF|nr:uncharacterized protein LOC109827476 [Asparagus officinalis]ONK55345.1 uncharacterized protein A4U43_UnF4540 [Asparagus officinalis]